MKRTNQGKSLILLLTLFLLSMVIPVQAWSDIGVEYYDDIHAITGEWSENDNTALEEYVFIMSYQLEIVFEINSIDLTADVYKVHIDFDGGDGDPVEKLKLYYGWGDPDASEYIGEFGPSAQDFYCTITDASDTTLYIRIVDNCHSLDSYRDQWDFGREPELWLYWY